MGQTKGHVSLLHRRVAPPGVAQEDIIRCKRGEATDSDEMLMLSAAGLSCAGRAKGWKSFR